MESCMNCGAELSRDEIGLYLKMVDRRSTSFLCISCLSESFSLPEQELREMIVRFKRAGCSLFDKDESI